MVGFTMLHGNMVVGQFCVNVDSVVCSRRPQNKVSLLRCTCGIVTPSEWFILKQLQERRCLITLTYHLVNSHHVFTRIILPTSSKRHERISVLDASLTGCHGPFKLRMCVSQYPAFIINKHGNHRWISAKLSKRIRLPCLRGFLQFGN